MGRNHENKSHILWGLAIAEFVSSSGVSYVNEHVLHYPRLNFV